MTNRRRLIVVAYALTSLVLLASVRAETAITLASEGRTRYTIVKPAEPTEVDAYATRQLAHCLGAITGAEFSVVEPRDLPADGSFVFVGMSAPVLERLGMDPLPALADQEHVCRSVGQDVLLYGKGIHGQLWAVVEFLENSLGWRWYTPLEDPVVPSKPTLVLAPFHRKKGASFKHRQMQALFNSEFYYLHGMNMGWQLKKRPDHYVSQVPCTQFTHTLLSYIPPAPGNRYANKFKWQDKKDYFKTNPEFFTLDAQGRRVANKQLCLSNPQLRLELTKNILRDIAHAEGKGWGRMYVTVTAADTGGRFCHCPGCVALEAKYRTNGGPILDYAIGLCGVLRKRHPGVLVKIAAYRRSQTQDPPVLPDGEMLPENLIVSFAPIEDCFFADWWNHRDPMIQDTYNDLLGWGRISHNLMCWIYPSPSGTGVNMPVALIDRITNNFRLMHYAGVDFVFADHVTILRRSGFSELQRYLMLKLMKDIDCDPDAVIKDFTDHHYGAAAALMRRYIRELEQCRIDMELPPGIGEASYGVTYKSHTYDNRTFPYLTVENIHRWQTCFEQMEELTADQPRPLLNVQTVRRELDLATLLKWLDLTDKFPGRYKDHEFYVSRVRTVNAKLKKMSRWLRPLGEEVLNEFVLNIKIGGKNAPVPDRFKDVDPARIRQYIPRQHWRGLPQIIEAPDAPLGYAAPVHRPDNPLMVRFYQLDRRRAGATRHVHLKDITPGKYQLYELGLITITPDCRIEFSARSCQTNLQIGTRLYEPGAGNQWNAHVSLKFGGPTYGGKAKEDQVLVGRIILIAMSPDQFKE